MGKSKKKIPATLEFSELTSDDRRACSAWDNLIIRTETNSPICILFLKKVSPGSTRITCLENLEFDGHQARQRD